MTGDSWASTVSCIIYTCGNVNLGQSLKDSFVLLHFRILCEAYFPCQVKIFISLLLDFHSFLSEAFISFVEAQRLSPHNAHAMACILHMCLREGLAEVPRCRQGRACHLSGHLSWLCHQGPRLLAACEYAGAGGVHSLF